jgi:hypothetical protein
MALGLAAALGQPIPQAQGAKPDSVKVTRTPPMVEFHVDAKYPDPYWRSASPEKLGIDAAKLEAAVSRIGERGLEIHGMVVARNGKLAFERYGWKTNE